MAAIASRPTRPWVSGVRGRVTTTSSERVISSRRRSGGRSLAHQGIPGREPRSSAQRQDLHPERPQPGGHRAADVAVAHDPDGAAFEPLHVEGLPRARGLLRDETAQVLREEEERGQDELGESGAEGAPAVREQRRDGRRPPARERGRGRRSARGSTAGREPSAGRRRSGSGPPSSREARRGTAHGRRTRVPSRPRSGPPRAAARGRADRGLPVGRGPRRRVACSCVSASGSGTPASSPPSRARPRASRRRRAGR